MQSRKPSHTSETKPPVCGVCGETDPTAFYQSRRYRCKACICADQKRHREADPERYRTLNAAYNARSRERRYEQIRAYREQIRDDTFAAYGGAFCACCGETRREFLTLDHINGGGGRERRESTHKGGVNWYAVLRRQGFPPGYRVLCMNCNHSLGMRGYCPHQREAACRSS